MEQFSHLATRIFKEAIAVYEREGSIDSSPINPYQLHTIEHDLFRKNWIDNAQWCLEDIIRDPEIDPVQALIIKRRIDKSNQERTDLVELIDSFFLQQYASVQPQSDAKINTESPAWAIDRLSILELKIYNMNKALQGAGSDEDSGCEKRIGNRETEVQSDEKLTVSLLLFMACQTVDAVHHMGFL